MFFHILHHCKLCEEYPTKEALSPLRRASGAYYALAASTEKPKRGLAYIFDKLQLGKLKVVIAKTFPLEQYADAHRYLESNGQIGRVVVTV
jgi:NADPH:quinone reductase-like Zn-dependent oxidoreductase